MALRKQQTATTTTSGTGDTRFPISKPVLETTQAHTDVYVEKPYEFQVVLEQSPKEGKFDITYRVNQQANHLAVTRSKDNGACGKHDW